MDEQSELTPAQSEAVRRLLAGARDDEGIPDDVAARLESVLAELSAERSTTPVPREAEVIPLRRRWPKVLVAAAAVTAFGFGIVQLVGNSANDADSAGAGADSKAERNAATADDLASGPEQAPLVPGPASTPGDSAFDGVQLRTLSQQSLNMIGLQGLRQLNRGTLEQDLAELTRTSAPEATNGGDYSYYDLRGAKVSCGPFYTVVGGETFAASYRRHLALVLFHPKLDGVRLVEIYDCEGRTPRRAVKTVTLQTGE